MNDCVSIASRPICDGVKNIQKISFLTYIVLHVRMHDILPSTVVTFILASQRDESTCSTARPFFTTLNVSSSQSHPETHDTRKQRTRIELGRTGNMRSRHGVHALEMYGLFVRVKSELETFCEDPGSEAGIGLGKAGW